MNTITQGSPKDTTTNLAIIWTDTGPIAHTAGCPDIHKTPGIDGYGVEMIDALTVTELAAYIFPRPQHRTRVMLTIAACVDLN